MGTLLNKFWKYMVRTRKYPNEHIGYKVRDSLKSQGKMFFDCITILSNETTKEEITNKCKFEIKLLDEKTISFIFTISIHPNVMAGVIFISSRIHIEEYNTEYFKALTTEYAKHINPSL